jgi:hypothetical protein
MTPSALLPATRKIVEELESLSGYPVSFLEDPSLKVLATVRIATAGSPIHLIRYKPGASSPDYQIAVEAGHAIRMFRHPIEKRFQLSSNPAYRFQVADEVANLHPGLPRDRLNGVSDFLYDSLVLQLRSCPTGLLVDYSIYRSYPSLRSPQAQSLKEQLATNLKPLAPEQMEQFPKSIVNANRAMNSAFAIGVSELLGEPHLAVPYRAAGLEKVGLDLLSDLPLPDSDEIDDRALITAWAARLGLEQWLKWLPFH